MSGCRRGSQSPLRKFAVLVIPFWYRIGMTRQIAVRLPDHLVEFIDDMVTTGRARSRASVVAAAVARDRRREAAERDARILAADGRPDEFAGLSQFAAGRPLGLE